MATLRLANPVRVEADLDIVNHISTIEAVAPCVGEEFRHGLEALLVRATQRVISVDR
jgi:hypothetical protein